MRAQRQQRHALARTRTRVHVRIALPGQRSRSLASDAHSASAVKEAKRWDTAPRAAFQVMVWPAIGCYEFAHRLLDVEGGLCSDQQLHYIRVAI